MKKGYATILFFLALLSYATAQSIQWSKHLKHEVLATAAAVEIDEANNIYVGGLFEGDFQLEDEWLSSRGGRDIYIAKLNSSGDLLWVKSFGSEEDDNLTDLAVDREHIAITGSYWRSILFDEYELKTTVSESGLFYAQLSSEGAVQWANKIDGVGTKFIRSIAIHPLDNNVATLSTSREESNPENQLVTNITVTVVNNLGNSIWTNTLYVKGKATGIGLDYFNDGSVVVTGNFEGSIAEVGTDSIETNTTDTDVFIWKIAAGGESAWLKKAGGVFQDEVSGVKIYDDQIFVAGSFVGVLSTNDSLQIQSVGFNDNIFLLAYNSDGDALWAKSFGGVSLEKCTGLAIHDDQIALVGYYLDELNIDRFTFAGSPTSFAGLLLTTNLDGGVLSAQVFRSDQNLLLNDVAVFEDNIVLGGDFQGQLQIQNINYEASSFNPLIVKFGTTTSTENIIGNQFHIVSTSDGITINTTSQRYTVALFDAAGRKYLKSSNLDYLSTEHLPSGLYFLVLISEGQFFTYSVVISN